MLAIKIVHPFPCGEIFFFFFWGGGGGGGGHHLMSSVVAQLVERTAPGEEVPGLIPAVAARSLQFGSVSV